MRTGEWYCAIVRHSEVEVIVNTPLLMIKLNTANTEEKKVRASKRGKGESEKHD